MQGCTPIHSYPRVHNVWGICMIACRLFEHYLFPLLFFLFLWLSAVRMHTHPWAKESKIDHTSNWSRCTGTGSSSRAELSHAGKIMHPELTAQHTRLPSTSFFKMQPQPHYRSQNKRGNIEIHRWFTHKWLSNVVPECRVVDALRLTWWASLAQVMVAHSLCHVDCWQWHNLRGEKGRQHGHSG